MRRWSPALFAVTLGAIVYGLIGYAAEQRPSAPAASKAQPAATSSGATMDAQTAKIIWFGNAIEAAAMAKLLKAINQQTELQRIAALLEESRIALTAAAIGCRWACPPGYCSPDCEPKIAIEQPIWATDPGWLQKPGNGPIVIYWYVAVLENLALEAPSERSADVVKQLRGALGNIGRLP